VSNPTEAKPFDVVAMGEILLEVATDVPFGHGVPAQLGISGDALNVAAAAAAAGARTALLAVLPDDDLGQAVAARIAELGISTDLLKFRPGQQGVYLVHCDPDGQREFSYARSGSVGSTLGPDDVDPDVFAAAGAVIAGGIACAISATSRAAVYRAAEVSRRFVFDPNYRPRLTSVEDATAAVFELAPKAFLVTPSFPGRRPPCWARPRLPKRQPSCARWAPPTSQSPAGPRESSWRAGPSPRGSKPFPHRQ
jgi:2-dehydro-3-deoxygluconokinase